jgi:hypothetical protein
VHLLLLDSEDRHAPGEWIGIDPSSVRARCRTPVAAGLQAGKRERRWLDELGAWLDALRGAPSSEGRLEVIIRRPEVERKISAHG